MGIENRDWYWKSRAARKSADDAYFLQTSKARAPSPRLIAGLIGFAAALALSCFAVSHGWFAREPQPSADAVAREIEALRKWDEASAPSRPAPIVHPSRADQIRADAAARPRPDAFDLPQSMRTTKREGIERVVEAVLAVFAVASPFALLGLLIALFFRRARRAAGWGLVGGAVGLLASTFGGFASVGLWSWMKTADGLGAAIQFVSHAAGSFTLGAIVAMAVARILRRGERLQPEGALDAAGAAGATGTARTRK